jgi:miniconductance mechanosensitive channel
VQNWDRTITTIPTYALVSESFNNWKGMQESGGRRIKRAVYIDVNSIRFCDTGMLTRFGQFELIKDYVGAKEEEIRKYNSERNLAEEDVISGRRQTNVGIFRKYLENYLKNNQRIRQDMTFLVRQLQPGEKGLPIEIYVFSRETAWADYENLQSDIFDHVLAVIPEFGLRVFQAPSGSDIIAAAGNLNSLKAQV